MPWDGADGRNAHVGGSHEGGGLAGMRVHDLGGRAVDALLKAASQRRVAA